MSKWQKSGNPQESVLCISRSRASLWVLLAGDNPDMLLRAV